MSFEKGNKVRVGLVPWNKGKHISVKCENCGKDIDRLETSKTKHFFCNHTCHSDWKKKQTHVTVICDFCGKEIFRHQKDVESAEYHFCSKECFARSPHGKFQIGNEVNAGRTPWNKGKPHMRGEAHPLYGKGHAPESIEKMRESHKGIHPSEETREKLRARVPPYTKGTKRPEISGDKHPSYGKKRTEETRRKMRENHADFSGENGSAWIDGRSFKPYCPKFNNQIKNKIRDRDNHVCQLCGRTEKENKKKLDVHHIHYDKENCEPDLITLCRFCNSKVNTNRDYYENLFIIKLKNINLIKV